MDKIQAVLIDMENGMQNIESKGKTAIYGIHLVIKLKMNQSQQ